MQHQSPTTSRVPVRDWQRPRGESEAASRMRRPSTAQHASTLGQPVEIAVGGTEQPCSCTSRNESRTRACDPCHTDCGSDTDEMGVVTGMLSARWCAPRQRMRSWEPAARDGSGLADTGSDVKGPAKA